MEIFKTFLGVIFKKPLKEKVYLVFIEDKYYDRIIDNDDLEDCPTVIKVTYTESGKIINREFPARVRTILNGNGSVSKKEYCFRGEDSFHGTSSTNELRHFYRICGINLLGGMKEHKKYSIAQDMGLI